MGNMADEDNEMVAEVEEEEVEEVEEEVELSVLDALKEVIKKALVHGGLKKDSTNAPKPSTNAKPAFASSPETARMRNTKNSSTHFVRRLRLKLLLSTMEKTWVRTVVLLSSMMMVL